MNIELCEWYNVNQRDLPWRQTNDPYLIWISEIMLQQTQVNTVIPYYVRFIERFPTVQKLAQATDEELIFYWQGLGYYQRVRNLRKGAQQIVSEFNSCLPNTLEALMCIAGIGPYTAGAIASIAYGIKAPAVDGNVFRVFSRFLGIDLDIGINSTRIHFEKLVLHYMENQSPSIFNQALMELGATICTKQLAKCDICPLSAQCYAHKHQVVMNYPKKLKKTKQKIYTYFCALIMSEKGILISKNETRLLEGFWHLPQVECESEVYFMDWLEQKYDRSFHFTQVIHNTHLFTHQKWLLNGYVVNVVSDDIELAKDEMWYSELNTDTHFIAMAHKKLIDQIKK